MSKQTAVEWLFEQMLDDKLDRRYEFLEQAIEMEREQIVKAWEYGCMTNYGDAQTYYNEVYKGGQQ